MGPAINTAAWDAYYSVPASGDYAYYVKDGDIYRIRLRPEQKPLPVTLVSGSVFNLKTKEQILDAEVQYEDLSTGKTAGIASTKPGTGEYKIVLPYGTQYGIIARAKNFFSVSEKLDLGELKEYKEVRKDLFLAPVEVGQIIRLNNIFFDFGKAILRPESFPELDRTVSFLRQNPAVHIEISGHTDLVGAEEDNLRLSSARAKAVMDYLIEKGVDASSMTSVGYGESRPVGDNNTEEGRQMNRRVQFEILSK
jgi:outer membrane protein OmpA-like peptidoglycan-associated protein